MNFVKKNWILILILLVGAFMRLYKIDAYMTFLGDEGRDVIIVRNLLTKADPILIGPGTSVGGMYLGPLYYYFMAPFLLLSNFSPVGPAIGVALLGVATIYLVYLVGRDWFPSTGSGPSAAGLIASGLFAISPTVINYSHSSWNPNIMPFFALLSTYSIWKVYKSREASRKVGWWLVVSAISFAFVLQSHYLGLLLAPVLIIYYCKTVNELRVTSYGLKNSPLATRHFITQSLVSLLVFLFLMSPLLIFDIRHGWINSKALYKFITVREETSIANPLSSFAKLYPSFEQVNSSLLVAKQDPLGKIISLVLFTFVLYILFFKKKNILHPTYYILLLWLFSGLIGLGLYNKEIYDHYFGFLFPVPFLLIGFLLSKMYESRFKIFSIFLFSIFLFVNLSNNPLLKYPNNQMQRAKNVSNKVLEIAEGKPFNLAVLAERNYEDGYRYFMEVAGAAVMHADRWDQKTIVDNLIVICEKPKNECDPTHSPKAEVANFGMSKIESEYEVDGVIIYKLIHNYPN